MTSYILEELDIEGTQAPMILLLGQTGAGNSHFINSLKPGSVRESAHSMSCRQDKIAVLKVALLTVNIIGTSRPELIEVEIDGKSFLLVDTPGFNDTWRDFKRSDSVILEEIARTLAIQKQLGVKLV
jgi:predicted GTPase